MRKVFSILLLTCLVLSYSATFTYAEDIDEQIATLEQQISDLQDQLDVLKAQKAQGEVGALVGSDAPYVETDRIFNIYDSYGDTRYEAIIEITNTSSDPLYLNDATFDLEDADGHLIQTDDMVSSAPSVIKPGEKGYFYNQFGADIDPSVDVSTIQFVPHYKVEKANNLPHEYPLSDLSLGNDEWGGVKIVGRVLNDTDDSDASVYIHALFYNAEGKIIGITGTNVYEMPVGENSSFDISSMYAQTLLDAGSIADYKVIAQDYYYQF